MNQFQGKRVLIAGLGKSGIAAVHGLLALGAQVAVQDAKNKEQLPPSEVAFLQERGIHCDFGKDPENPGSFHLCVLSPGISPQMGFVQEARRAGVLVIGELELAYRMGHCNFAAITGTNGKTTTTALTGEIFKNAGRETYVVGNIGVAVTSAVLDAGRDAWMITETSSFQLETTDTFKPRVSALLNLTPDHLDRHKTMEGYARAKAKIFANQDKNDFFVVNYDDSTSYELAKECDANVVPFSRSTQLPHGLFVKDGEIVFRPQANDWTSSGSKDYCSIYKVSKLKIPGSHNLENALAATAIALCANIDHRVIAETLGSFTGVAHRLEFCGEIKGIRFVNDSKGTNPDATMKAIQAMPGGIVLIAGGYDKDSEFEPLIRAFAGKVKHAVLMGKTAEKIQNAALNVGFRDCVMAENMESCVSEAFRLAQPGDTVLLSPACASWDMYSCFEQRGEHFKKCVAELRG